MRTHSFSRIGMIIAMLISVNSFAATGGSEVALFTPWTFIQKKVTAALTAHAISDQENIVSADWNLAPWTPHLTDVRWNLKSKIDLTSFTPQNMQIKTKQLSFAITIKQFNLDQIIERNVDGAIIRVHVQAQCGPITMSQASAQMDARLTFQIQPQQILTALDRFNLSWAPNSWQVSDFTCQGPGGFDQTIKQELAQDLKSAEKVRPWLQPLIAARIQAEANALMTQIGNPISVPTQSSRLPLVLTFRRMQAADEGILNFGTLVWSGKSGETDLSRLLMNGVPVGKSTLPVFISPTEGWNNLVAAQLIAKGESYKMDMAQIKAFKDLLSSPSQEYAVWPDLANYSPNSKFTMVIARPRGYSLKWQSDGTALAASPIAAVIQSNRGGKTWNYVALNGSVQGKLSPSIASGKLNISAKFSGAKFAAQMQPAYVQAFQANALIDPRVTQAFEDYVTEGFKYSTPLPVLNLGFAGKASFKKWTGISRDLIGMSMDVTP